MKEIITLENGIRIVLEPIDYLRSANFGIWVASGSINEDSNNNGSSHFLEHMSFKGTKTATAYEIAENMDSIGGQINAVTSKNYTCFYARTLSEHVKEGFSILADMVVNSTIDEEDFKVEKNVILEELAMSEDDPWDILSEQLSRYIWDESDYGRPILGTKESLDKITYETLREYRDSMYVANRIVISICGRYNKNEFINSVKEAFSKTKKGKEITVDSALPFKKGLILNECEREQTYISIAMKGLEANHTLRYPLAVLNCVAGSSTSSRLFQQIREKSGLAYTVYSDITILKNGGLFGVSACVNPKNSKQAVSEIIEVLKEIKQNGISEKELKRAKENIKSSLVMATESPNGRSNKNGRNLLLGVDDLSEDDLIKKIDSITLSDIFDVANLIFDFDNMAISLVGIVEDKEYFENLVK